MWATYEDRALRRLKSIRALKLVAVAGFVVSFVLFLYTGWLTTETSKQGVLAATLSSFFAAIILLDRRYNKSTRRLSRRTELVLNSAGEGIYGLDQRGHVDFVNPAAARLTGHETDELIGKHQHSLIHHSRPDGSPYPADECPAYASLKEGTVHHVAGEVYWRKDGSSFPVEYTSTPIIESAKVVGTVVTFSDITQRVALESLKDEFVSVVSHELRTPLTSIRGSLGLLTSGVLGSLPEKGKRMLDIAVTNTDRLVRLINDILDIERMESGKINMEMQAVNVAEVMTESGDVMQAMAQEAGVTLSVVPHEATLYADQDRIMQALTNLLSNAIKFSPRDAHVWCTAESNNGEVTFRIKDEGRGIPPDHLERVFERFQQVDASDSRQKEGTGLGLAICRSIVEHHGGRIWVDSTEGKGSTFSLALPTLRRHTKKLKAESRLEARQ